MKNSIFYFGIFYIITIIGASSFVANAVPVIDDSKKPSYLIQDNPAKRYSFNIKGRRCQKCSG